jgi:hypothetical protein
MRRICIKCRSKRLISSSASLARCSHPSRLRSPKRRCGWIRPGADNYGQLDSKRSDVSGANFDDQFHLHAVTAGRFRQPDDVGNREQREPAIWQRGISRGKDLLRPGHVYVQLSPPAAFVNEFRKYYGPTMNAFEAAEQNGQVADLQRELEELFNRLNQSPRKEATSIPATFLRVTVWLGLTF